MIEYPMMRKLINILCEAEANNHSQLINEYLTQLSSSVKKLYSKRDNCGPCALNFIDWVKKTYNIQLSRVEGYFRADGVVYDKADFTPEMKREFLQQGGDFSAPHQRKQWIENSKYNDEWHNIPHYWAVDDQGNIYDPAGVLQFQDKLAADLNSSRYIK